MSWKKILKRNTRYTFAIGNKDGFHMQFITTLIKINGDVATVRDDDGSFAHFDINLLSFASETPVDGPLPAAMETEPDGKDMN